ncbi:FtsX-like permease family protein [Clostridium ganghwense]|uniref:ABC transporter permease n=1 Tax=Clostridium ganghwense TaxID=312089 RepID=A0ABT4CQ69_9CLOT|nr:ABC transporter permease [Clostridium ganghwense]MCY6371195.1 ABC transporter permease [Clostridium ganghwense]
MMYFNIAYKNLTRSVNNYLTYFTSIICSIAAFYILQSIRFNNQVIQLIEMKKDMEIGFKVAGYIIIVVVAVSMIYANMFFIRKRKREIGMYAMLGMKESKIGIMLFSESIMLGGVALVVGIGLGILLSKGFIIFLMNLAGIYKVNFAFSIPSKALLGTTLFCMSILIVSSVYNYMVVYCYKLVDLLKGEAIREKDVKNMKVFHSILGLISMIILLYGYSLAIKLGNNPQKYSGIKAEMIEKSFFSVVIATYGLWISAAGMLFKWLERCKTYYFKDLNLFLNRQMTHRIRTNAKMLATVTILISITTGAFGTSFSYYYKIGSEVDKNLHFSYEVDLKMDTNTDGLNKKQQMEVNEIFEKYKNQNPIQYDNTVCTATIPVKILGITNKRGNFIRIIDETSYNKMVLNKENGYGEYHRMAKLEKYTDVLVVGSNSEVFKQEFKMNNKIFDDKTFNVIEYEPSYLDNIKWTCLVFKDEVFEKLKKYAEQIRYHRYVIVKNEKESKALSYELSDYMPKGCMYYFAYAESMNGGAIFIFVGLFVGLVFLFASGSVLSMKQLTESATDRIRYNILRKIGASEKKVKRVIGKQIGIIFFMPVLLAVVHNYFALRFVKVMLNTDITIPIMITSGVALTIYMFYYLITVKTYYHLTK